MLDSIYHMILKSFLNHFFWRENIRILPSFHNVSRKSVNHQWFIGFNA